MITAIRVSLGPRSYPIYLDHSYARLPRLLEGLAVGPDAVVVSHRSLLERFGASLTAPLRKAGWSVGTISVPESELSKSYETAESVMRRLVGLTRMRSPLLIAFGGGVVGDLTGFVAAVFRRGIPYIHVPTTLLAQVDSAIGGKVGVDLPAAKNMVGAFYQPRAVFNQLDIIRTLPPRQRRCGLSEIIKYAAIADPFLFRFLERNMGACLSLEPRAVRLMVERCCRIKARVVSADERETRGVRTQLNFGHTLGHALETVTGYTRFTHGEAIAVGMACASRLSVEMKLLPAREHERLTSLLREAGLPTQVSGVCLEELKQALRHDKKFIHGAVRLVLLRAIGRVVVSEAAPTDLLWRCIRRHVAESR